MKRFTVQWHGPKSGEALRRLLVQGRTFAALAVCSCIFFVAAGLAGMAYTHQSKAGVSSMQGFAAAVSAGFFADMLGMELPAFEASNEAAEIGGRQTASFVIRLLTGVNPDNPRSLMASELPGMRDDTVLLRRGSHTDTGAPPEDLPPLPGIEDEAVPGAEPGLAAGNSGGIDTDGASAGGDDAAGGGNGADSGEADGRADVPGGEPAKPTTGNRKVVFIYHSHPRESWVPELPEGTKDANSSSKNITLVGKRLAERLAAEGVGAEHSGVDYPTAVKDYRWELSYKYSKQTVVDAMARNDELEFFFDIHRDSQPRKYTTAEINGKDYAQVYFIIGHRNPEWRKNEAFAAKIHEALEKDYPGISRGIWGKDASTGNGEYNQSLAPESVIIEIGGPENTLEECYRTADALAKVITEIYWSDEEVDAPAKAGASA